MAPVPSGSDAIAPVELEPGEERVATWPGHAGSRRAILVLTDRRLLMLTVRGLWNRKYELSASYRLEELPPPRAHDAYGGRRLEIGGEDLSFSEVGEDAVQEQILRSRAMRISRAPPGSTQ